MNPKIVHPIQALYKIGPNYTGDEHQVYRVKITSKKISYHTFLRIRILLASFLIQINLSEASKVKKRNF